VATQHARATPSAETSAQLEQPTAPKLPALNAQACDDAARKPAAATNDKPARSWTKCTTRRANTSYRLTLELSGGVAVRLERNVRPHATRPKGRGHTRPPFALAREELASREQE